MQLLRVRAIGDDICSELVIYHLQKIANGSDGKYLVEDIVEIFKQDKFQIWVASKNGIIYGTLLTEIITYPRKRTMRCVGIAGENAIKWVKLLIELEEIAKSWGCDMMESCHPVKFEKLLVTGGWREFHRLWVKDLS